MPSDFLPSLSETLRLRASIFFRLELATPWGFALTESENLRLHIVKRGRCVLGGEGLAVPLQLQEGDIAILRQGQRHWIADQAGRPLFLTDDVLRTCQEEAPPFQEGTLTHKLICGKARIHDRGGGWLVSLLPDVLHFRHEDLRDDRVWKVVEAINAKSTPLGEDDTGVLDRLAEALFLCLLGRAAHLELKIGHFGRAAHQDPQVRNALLLMHSRLDEPWTIQNLAEQSGVSRAALARRFKDAVGMPAMEYLRQVRISRAMQMLLDGAGLSEVASGVGYSSPEAFRKVFKRHTGSTPASYLREALAQDEGRRSTSGDTW